MDDFVDEPEDKNKKSNSGLRVSYTNRGRRPSYRPSTKRTTRRSPRRSGR